MCETPLHFKTITEIAEEIASKQLSPVGRYGCDAPTH